LERSGELFKTAGTQDADKDRLIADLYQQLGKAEMEREWLKKKLGSSRPGRGVR
jgi:hypothetical protein